MDADTAVLSRHVQADLDQILVDRDRIAGRVAELAAAVSRDLAQNAGDAEIVLVPILTGSIIFLADLIRLLPQKLRIEVVNVTSYPGKSVSSQGSKIVDALSESVEGKHVLVVDDILDSGGTIKLIRAELTKQNPKSLRTCVLLRKQRPSALDTPCEYVGFDIPDVFVVGYGLDYNGYYRNLPDIGTLKKEAML